VSFQFPNLSRDCKPHKPVFDALERNKLDENCVRLGEPMAKVLNTLPIGFESLLVKEKEKDKVKDKAKDKPEDAEIPPVLSSPEFIAAWSDWCAYRRERGHALKPRTASAQLAQMAEWGQLQAITAIRKSIMQGWQGVFQPDANQRKTSQESEFSNAF